MPLTNGFNHIATLTTDLDRFKAWYLEVFDAPTTFEMAAEGDHPRMAIIDMGGGAALNVFEVGADQIIGDQRRIGARGAIDHFGLAVADRTALEDVRDRLERAGADIGEIQILGGDTYSLFFRDVDGMELEVCAPVGADGS
ncbi:MAG: VOC family protein [Microthrixaceae bacterium]|jgi:catechol 2,3-dioxygenase-like lactoylglutathione lyase family enzyme|nr:VOC family protein [Microthrixaceae bacterium]